MKIDPRETNLMGQWQEMSGRVQGDAIEARIGWLITNHLEKVADGNWTVLYRDPGDGRLWELTYPHGEMHGGGPKRLTVLSADDAAKRYP